MKNKPTLAIPITAGLTSLAISLTSCTGASKPYTPVPASAKTISQIYGQHQGSHHSPRKLTHHVPISDRSLHGYSRNSFNEISALFSRLPNPSFVLYIFPHLSEEGTPVPGYSTVFEMYESVNYALPGEM